MKEIKKLTPEFVLRIGVGLTFLYAGLHVAFDPTSWIGFVPHWLGTIINPYLFLTIHGIVEIILGALILSGFFIPIASLLAFLDLFSILVFYGVDDTTFRDFGLMMAVLALFLLSRRR